MHPEIVRDAPGPCPICGMALEPTDAAQAEGENPELAEMVHGNPLAARFSPSTLAWVQLGLGTPVVLWGGWPFFVRGWASLRTLHLNMFTLIAIGTGAAWIYSAIAAVWPDVFPPSFRGPEGEVAVYFEAAAVIVTLVLLGQVLELRAQPDRRRDSRAPGAGAEDGATYRRRRLRRRCPARRRTARRPASRATGRADSRLGLSRHGLHESSGLAPRSVPSPPTRLDDPRHVGRGQGGWGCRAQFRRRAPDPRQLR
jgi:hypothetical protein